MTDESLIEIGPFRGQWAFLSSFGECPNGVTIDGIRYPRAEHAYQAYKTPSVEGKWVVADLKTPGEAKRWGRSVCLPPDWDKNSRAHMMRVQLAKFTQDDHLQGLLAGTGDRYLNEKNWWHDQFWGDCECGTRLSCAEPGQNYLGRILMAVRMVVA